MQRELTRRDVEFLRRLGVRVDDEPRAKYDPPPPVDAEWVHRSRLIDFEAALRESYARECRLLARIELLRRILALSLAATIASLAAAVAALKGMI